MVLRIVLGCGAPRHRHFGQGHSLLEHLLWRLVTAGHGGGLRSPMHLARWSLHQHRSQFILEVVAPIVIVFVRLSCSCLGSEGLDDGLRFRVIIIVIIVVAIEY